MRIINKNRKIWALFGIVILSLLPSIAQGDPQLIYPEGGETFQAGSGTINIQWTGEPLGTAKIEIRYDWWRTGVHYVATIIDNLSAGTTTYLWNIPCEIYGRIVGGAYGTYPTDTSEGKIQVRFLDSGDTFLGACNNSILFIILECPSSKPDLIVEDIFISNTNPCTDEPIVYYVVVKNVGDEPVVTAQDNQFRFRVWWSTEPTSVYDPSKMILSDYVPGIQPGPYYPSLAPGETAAAVPEGVAPSGYTYYFQVPASGNIWIPRYMWSSGGTYYLNVWVDFFDDVDESDEDNNFLSSEAITVSSSNPPSQLWQLLQSVLNSGVACDPVNTANGNYIHETTDISLPGIGLDFVFKRTYNSQAAEQAYNAPALIGTGNNNLYPSRPLGFGWTHSYYMYVQEQGLGLGANTVLVHMGGHNIFFEESGGSYTPKYPGIFYSLTKSSGQFHLTDKMQSTYTLGPEQVIDGVSRHPLVLIEDRNGHTMSFTLDGNGRIDSVTDTVSRTIAFQYDGAGRISKIRENFSPNREVNFSYDMGKLISCTDIRDGVTQYEYDSHWRLTRVIDPRGNTVVRNTYDTQSRVTVQENGRGKSTNISYTPSVKETTITDPKLNPTVHKHGDRFRLLWTKDPDNNSTTYEYDTDGNITRRVDPEGNETTFTYDSRGNMLSKTIVRSGGPSIVTNYTYYDPSDGKKVNLIQTMTEAVGTTDERTIQYEYDSNGNLTREYDSLGDFRRIEYYSDPPKMGLPQYSYDGNGHRTEFLYDPNGRITKMIDPEGNEKNFNYNNPLGTQKTVTDGNGNATVYDYDNAMNIISVIDPEGHTTSYEHDGNGNLTETKDPRGQSSGRATAYECDENNNLMKVTAPDGGETIYTYDDNGNKDSETDQSGNTTTYAYDAMNRMTAKTDPEGNTTTYGYDNNANLTSITTPDGKTTNFTYNERNLQTKSRDPLGNETVNTYDPLDRLVSVTDARGKTTHYTYNVRDQLVSVTDAIGGVTSYSYDSAGNLTAIMDAKDGQTATMEYYNNNLLKKKTDALGNSFTYEYDGVGNQTAVVDAKGDRTGFTYWPDNRLKTISYPTGPPANFSYDASGNRIQMTDSTGTTMYSYDDMNRVISTTDSFGLTVSYTYFQTGRRKTITYPENKTVSYTYDELNRLKTVTDWLGGATTYIYTNSGLLQRTDFPNGTYEERTYDDSHRLVYLANKKSNGSVICSYGYTLDPLGNPVAIDTNQPLELSLPSSNITYEYDADDRLTEAGGVNYTYDKNGNLTAKTGAIPTTYTYDYEDRLTSVTTPTQSRTYIYDGAGDRVSKSVSGTATRYLLERAGELENVIAEMDESNNVVAYYVHGAGLISKITPSGDWYVYHYDRTGNTIAITDSSEALANRYAYTPFGIKAGETETIANDFEFVGKFGVMQEDNNLLFMRTRFYDPLAGRFLSTDPVLGEIHRPQQWHSYVYVLNNPITFSDPSGLWDPFEGAGTALIWALNVSKAPGDLISSSGLLVGSIFYGGLYNATGDENYRDFATLEILMAQDIVDNYSARLNGGKLSTEAEDFVNENPRLRPLYNTLSIAATGVPFVYNTISLYQNIHAFGEAGGVPKLDESIGKVLDKLIKGKGTISPEDVKILIETVNASFDSLGWASSIFSERMPICRK